MQADQDSFLAAWENQNEFKKVVREKEEEEKKKDEMLNIVPGKTGKHYSF